MISKVLHSNKIVVNYKMHFKIALIGLLIGLYLFYYAISNLPSEYSFQTLFVDDFENRGLLILLGLIGVIVFLFYLKKKNTITVTEYSYSLELNEGKQEVKEIKRREKYLLTHGIKQILEDSSASYPILEKINEIIDLEEHTQLKQARNTTTGIPTSTVGSFAAHAGMPVETKTSVSEYYQKELFVTYKSGEKEQFFSNISAEKIKNFLKI